MSARNSIELRNLNEAHWRGIYRQYDTNGDGKINICELRDIIGSAEYKNDIPDHVVKTIFRNADTNLDGHLDFQEFMKMVNRDENQFAFSHLNFRAGMNKYIKLVVAPQQVSHTVTAVDGRYEDEYSCWPPVVFMILISLLEITLYCLDWGLSGKTDATGEIATAMIYDPYLRQQVWRYFSYMFVHVGGFHLLVNVFVQIMLGIPLEMVHKGPRVLTVYVAGVVAGSLGTSITDPNVRLAGASGGVYSLITAHVATIIMNWTDMSYPLIQLIILVILMGSDVGTAIYNRHVLQLKDAIGYAAHFFGALAGLLVGITVLRNIEVTGWERKLRWSAMIAFIMLIVSAVIMNIFWTSHFPVRME